jgi:hypothetical protein
MWDEQSMCDDIPGVFVIEEDVQKAGDILESFKVLLFDLIDVISDAKRQLDLAFAAIALRADLHAPESPEYNRGPPGHAVTTLPHRPTGPPLHRVAIFNDDALAAAD